MTSASAFLYVTYFLIVLAAIGKASISYQYRQLVKANFYINIGIFALVAFSTLLMLNEILGE